LRPAPALLSGDLGNLQGLPSIAAITGTSFAIDEAVYSIREPGRHFHSGGEPAGTPPGIVFPAAKTPW
jgi:hypothetical protein